MKKRAKTYIKAFESLNGEINYVKKQNDMHYKTTDETIKDLRKERDDWKERALAKNKKS